LSPKAFRGAVAALGGPRAATISPSPRVLGLTQLVPVTSCGTVLSLVHPYLRACKLLRWLAFPRWRRFESSGLRVVYACERGENLQPGCERHWNPEIGILLCRGHDAYHRPVTGGTSPGVASRKLGVLVCRPAPGWFLGFVRCGSLSRWVPFRIGSPLPLAKSGGAIPGTGCLTIIILLLLESVVSRLLGHNRRPVIFGV
jgi:hypothetical protein